MERDDVTMPEGEISEEFSLSSPEDQDRQSLSTVGLRRRNFAKACAAALIFGDASALLNACTADEPPVRSSADNRPRVPEVIRNLYEVDISHLKNHVLRDGILVIAHNGVGSDGAVLPGQGEYLRIVQNTQILGRNNYRGAGITKKSMKPLAIVGTDKKGADITRAMPEVTVYVSDGTHGRLSSEAEQTLRSKKFPIILVAGHIYDLSKLIALAKQYKSAESLIFLGGCRSADFIRDNYEPKSLYAGTVASLRTETFTHMVKITVASLLADQFSTWEDYFRTIRDEYSYEVQRNPGIYILPGNPRYSHWVRR